ncbi:winged helix-turn-helix transcriptional regulator [Actinokineospora sp. G85]|uniref:winged helix-turn-helix transcriptional regulator n=1 Tax=Actinokineospora sp. G85 TaxID=3406626 RepID=UPI003C710BA1
MTTRPGSSVCGIDAAMDVISGKWKVLILWELHVGTARFGALRRGLPGITEKVLTTHLRELERDGVITRREFDEVPPRVEYALTDVGRELNDALGPLSRWGEKHRMGAEPHPA